jgi:hypothetical protein
MHFGEPRTVLKRICLASVLSLGLGATALAAPHGQALHCCKAGTAAKQSYATLVPDAEGNLHGTTQGNPFSSQGPVTDGTVLPAGQGLCG